MEYKCRNCENSISGSDVFTLDNNLFCCKGCAKDWKIGQRESFPIKFRDNHEFWSKEKYVGGPFKKWWFWDVHFALNDIHKRMADVEQLNNLSLEVKDSEYRVDRMGKLLSDFGAMQVNVHARVKKLEKSALGKASKDITDDINDIKRELGSLKSVIEKIDRLERLLEVSEKKVLNSLN